ncbi:uncharacterized protein DS421_20g690480 [Arachis hypogaea]|nr:uncharacterized protein DS421_20g690480 [Arachis hypogaea]
MPPILPRTIVAAAIIDGSHCRRWEKLNREEEVVVATPSKRKRSVKTELDRERGKGGCSRRRRRDVPPPLCSVAIKHAATSHNCR